MNKYSINLDDIIKYKDKFIYFSKITESDIQNLWIKSNEQKKDLVSLVYNYDISLWEKMVWRFRNCNKCIVQFWIQIDPINKLYILHKYGFFENDIDNLMYFFAWIKNHLGKPDFDIICTDNKNMELIRWKSSNAIQFFFDSSDNFQKILLDKYIIFLSNY
jgi:hypothetical protein